MVRKKAFSIKKLNANACIKSNIFVCCRLKFMRKSNETQADHLQSKLRACAKCIFTER